MADNHTNDTSTTGTPSVIGGPGIFGFFRDDKPQYPKDLHPYPESYYIFLPKDKLHPISEWNKDKQASSASVQKSIGPDAQPVDDSDPTATEAMAVEPEVDTDVTVAPPTPSNMDQEEAEESITTPENSGD